MFGEVVDISVSASRSLLESAAVGKLASSNDAAVAMAGQVGAQVKVRVGNVWLIASIRDQQLDARGEGLIVATIDFLGEGEEEKITGRIHNFRRGRSEEHTSELQSLMRSSYAVLCLNKNKYYTQYNTH